MPPPKKKVEHGLAYLSGTVWLDSLSLECIWPHANISTKVTVKIHKQL